MTDNLRRLSEAIAKLQKAEWELISLRHDLQRQYEVLERQEASALELDIPEDEILAILVSIPFAIAIYCIIKWAID